jgi:hypothetical protein
MDARKAPSIHPRESHDVTTVVLDRDARRNTDLARLALRRRNDFLGLSVGHVRHVGCS